MGGFYCANLHDLQPGHQWKPDGTEKSFVAKLVNMNRMFSIFWLRLFVVVPLAAAVLSPFRDVLDRAGVPIPPL